MTNKIKDEDHDLFQTHMKDVKPLRKTKTIPTPKPFFPQSVLKTREILNIITPNLFNEDTIPPQPKIKKNPSKPKFKPGITLSFTAYHHPTITAEAILEFGLEHLSLTHQERLKKGLLSLNSRIDLHGQNRIDALDKLERFLEHAHSHHHRNLLIIHGKGAKHGDTPILKQEVYYYLIQHNYTLALRSALPKHGGSGALYLILKKPQNS